MAENIRSIHVTQEDWERAAACSSKDPLTLTLSDFAAAMENGLRLGIERGIDLGLTQELVQEFAQAYAQAFVKGFAQGFAIGEKNRSLKVARWMLSDGYSIDKIMQVTELSRQEIEQLRADS